MKKMTSKYQKAIQSIRGFYFVKKRMPSYSELAELLGYASKGGVRYLVDKLVNDNVLEKDSQGKILPKKLSGSYPILGSIRAGFPAPAEEDLIDTISFEDYLVDNPSATFLVTVNGDSMIEAGILPGDIVVVDRSKQAKNGDIVIAQVDNEWTMKYLDKKESSVSLRPANPKYPVIIPRHELNIGGVITGVVRKF